ncbi:hypothetical protein [Saccharothrix luteola]|uniref:hypothetical protein n=1 Tax=Saccharothrix luteola TaxID=2893018 RepID=UPI001E5DEA73|nr:hypothetical protein [Saccharothrix luteola]MCC8251602.1 hypothetical protein [Saccharothrix luteola]
MSLDDAESVAWPVLFQKPERLGWRFSDRTAHRREFGEQRPRWAGEAARPEGSGIRAALVPMVCRYLGGVRAPADDHGNPLARQLERVELDASRRSHGARLIAGGVFVLMLSGGFFSWLVSAISTWFHDGPGLPFGPTMLWSAGAAALGSAAVWWTWAGAVRALKGVVRRSWRLSYQRHEQDVREWEARRQRFEDHERARMADISDWTSTELSPGVKRVSVIGDNTDGAEALLTVLGASILAEGRSLTVLDLTGDIVVGELVRGAVDTGYQAAFRLLPTELAHVDLLTGMSTEQVVRLLVEARHGGQEKPDLVGRGVDERILTQVLALIAPGGLSMGRIAAALRMAMRARIRDTDNSLLSQEEREALRRGLTDEYRRHVSPHLANLEAMVGPLSAMGTGEVDELEGQLRVLSMSSDWTSAQIDFLGDLLVGWAARQVIDNTASIPTLVVTAADRLATRHLDRLSQLCERRGIRLVVLFRRFDETTARMVGRGSVAFMRLDDPQQATRAADFIGREYTFTVSQMSTTLGGQHTHSVANTVSHSDSDGRSTTESVNESRSRGKNRGAQSSTNVPKTKNTSRTKGWSDADTQSWNRTRSWGTTVSNATTDSWSDSETRQRVHEHRVDPEVIKNLPDYAMLLVESTIDGTPRIVRSVELNPEIAVLEAQPAGTRGGLQNVEALSYPGDDDPTGPIRWRRQ